MEVSSGFPGNETPLVRERKWPSRGSTRRDNFSDFECVLGFRGSIRQKVANHYPGCIRRKGTHRGCRAGLHGDREPQSANDGEKQSLLLDPAAPHKHLREARSRSLKLRLSQDIGRNSKACSAPWLSDCARYRPKAGPGGYFAPRFCCSV